jgi:HD-GYP domain-containing protein (c-di-GMP phosphodiesterase class II)
MSEDKYARVRLNSLPSGHAIPFDLYVQIGGKFIHYLRAGDKLAADRIHNLEKRAPESFYVLTTDRLKYKTFIHSHIHGNLLAPDEKAVILRESSMALVEELYESEDIERALDDSKEIIGSFIEFMGSDPAAMAHLVGLSSHDFYTYNHSLDVSIYCLGLGQAAGYSEADLQELGVGGLFHDIGKRNVPIEIITKAGGLDEAEWALMQKHPQYGLIILEENKSSDAIKACCFEHHESFLGNGYPQQLTGPEIHPMARITAIADTYDALTTKRSYNSPMRPKDAVDLILTKLAGRYDPDLLKALSEVLFRMQDHKIAV